MGNPIKEAINGIFEKEVENFPSIRKLPPGQRERYKKRFVEYMVEDLAYTFMKAKDPKDKVDIFKALSDYGGYKPSVQIEGSIDINNPYEQLTDEELDRVEKELIDAESRVIEEGEADGAEEAEDSES